MGSLFTVRYKGEDGEVLGDGDSIDFLVFSDRASAQERLDTEACDANCSLEDLEIVEYREVTQ